MIYVLCVVLITVAVIILFVILMMKGQNKANKFAENYETIHVGMSETDVISIFGSPTVESQIDETTKMLTWETSEWKGVFRGGTKSRSVTVVIKKSKVFSKTSKNLDMAGF